MPNFYGTPPSQVPITSFPQSTFSHQYLQQPQFSSSPSVMKPSTMNRGLSQHYQSPQPFSSYRVVPPNASSSSPLMFVNHDRSDRYKKSNSTNFISASSNSRHATFLMGKSNTARHGETLDTKGGSSMIISNSSSNNSNTNSDTSVLVHVNEKFADNFREHDESFLHLHPSWPVYVYTEKGEVFMRVLCVKVNTKEVIVFDPFSKRVFQQGYFMDIKKFSFDTNEEQDINTNFRLFRIQFNRMDTLIFLSKDRNEIINCLLYYAKEFRENDEEDIIIDKNPNEISFVPDINISLHHFQVFGIDKRGRYFPHILSLYSNHIRHVDSETKQSFSTHGYGDVEGDVEIDPDMPTKLTIRYRDDNPYSFLVSDKDRSEVLVLLQGRSFIYRPHTQVQFDGVELNTSLSELNPSSDFPQKITKNVTEVGVFLTEPEPVKNQSGFCHKAEDADELTERNNSNLEVLLKGVKLFMHVPKKLALRGKKTSAKQIFMRISYDKFLNKTIVQWGKSCEKLNHQAYVESIEEGESAIIESSKISSYLLSNFSFILHVDCKEKSATLGGRLFLVADGSVEYQYFIDGVTFLIEQQKIQRSLKK